MPSFGRDSQKIVIAGASSLLGAELKSLLEEGKFAGWDLRLLDEVSAAGTLTEAGGEPAVILPVEEGSFAGARLVFFTGSTGFTTANSSAALKSGARVIDLSGVPADREAACPWFPQLADQALSLSEEKKPFTVLSAPAVSSALLALALQPLGVKRLSITHFQPVSEAGRPGIDELQSQISQLLSFQPAGGGIFDAQVAFTLLNHFGKASQPKLKDALQGIRSQVMQALASQALMPDLTLLHAPVFSGAVFSACAELGVVHSVEAILSACAAAGFETTKAEEPLGNLSAIEQEKVMLATPQSDAAHPGTWWFWGTADNMRLPAWNAVKLAEKLTA
jgi:aspartate-semialdehyde dehydrogenase